MDTGLYRVWMLDEKGEAVACILDIYDDKHRAQVDGADTAKENGFAGFKVRDFEPNTDEDKPPMCFHQVCQPMVNTLWAEAKYWRARAELAEGRLDAVIDATKRSFGRK